MCSRRRQASVGVFGCIKAALWFSGFSSVLCEVVGRLYDQPGAAHGVKGRLLLWASLVHLHIRPRVKFRFFLWGGGVLGDYMCGMNIREKQIQAVAINTSILMSKKENIFMIVSLSQQIITARPNSSSSQLFVLVDSNRNATCSAPNSWQP